MTKKFAVIGVGGYIAPRHMKAIKDTGNQMIAALDKNDSVGIIDSYFPDTDFFTEFERFDRHIDKLRRKGDNVDFVSICTPNYLHDAHIRFALRSGASVVCEKPLVLNPWNIDALEDIANETGNRVFNILQLRLHPQLIALKNKLLKNTNNQKWEIDLTYITSRGNWYFQSWKADLPKSGGIATNIGIHFFDLMYWLFGDIQINHTHLLQPQKCAGYMELQHARVRWFLSVDNNDLPLEIKLQNKRTFRALTINGEEVEFSDGFTDLHTLSYQEILAGNGFEINETRPSITAVHQIRNSVADITKYDLHKSIQNI